jgi:hypothetical protein
MTLMRLDTSVSAPRFSQQPERGAIDGFTVNTCLFPDDGLASSS